MLFEPGLRRNAYNQELTVGVGQTTDGNIWLNAKDKLGFGVDRLHVAPYRIDTHRDLAFHRLQLAKEGAPREDAASFLRPALL